MLSQYKNDWFWVGVLILETGYLSVRYPLLLAVFGCASLLLLGLYYLSQAIATPLKFWQVAAAIMTTTALLTTLEAPSYAIFLKGLEDFVATLATSSNSGIDASTITLIFNMIRAVFLLLVAAAALFAYNQAQQGNDWRPIVGQVAMAFAIVIAMDVVTFLFVGQGTTGG
jgi:hypothetical protein